LYTRIELYGTNQVGPTQNNGNISNNDNRNSEYKQKQFRDYNSEKRNPIGKLFVGKADTVTVIANIIASDPTLTQAIPLYSISHVSGPNINESWSTNFTASSVQSPLFRISPNTALTIDLDAKISQDVTSQGASMAVGAITKAVSIASPTSALLTTLSSNDVKNASSAIDTAISSLASQDLSEEISLGRLIDSWTPNSFISINGCAPFIKLTSGSSNSSSSSSSSSSSTSSDKTDNACPDGKDLNQNPDIQVGGGWTLRLACPRPSAFHSRDICNLRSSTNTGNAKEADKSDGSSDDGSSDNDDIASHTKLESARQEIANAVSDGQILSFRLSSQVTIQSFVQAQDWYTAFISEPPNDSSSTASKNSITTFCAAAVVGMEQQGLNGFDSALVVRAMFRQLPKITIYSAAYRGDAGAPCQTMLSTLGVKFPDPSK
jgi:hypothetical protein